MINACWMNEVNEHSGGISGDLLTSLGSILTITLCIGH